MNALARVADSTDRLHDALVSLRFLIEVDVMAQPINQVCILFFIFIDSIGAKGVS